MRRQGAGLCACLAGVLLALTPQAARASPWPRGLGEWFLSSSVTLGRGQPRSRSEVYAEGGLGRGWLVFGSLGVTGAGDRDFVLGLGRARVLRGGAVLGWGIALGARQPAGGSRIAFLRPGIAVGRGFVAGERVLGLPMPYDGWASAEFQVELTRAPRAAVPKLDLTFGLKPAPGWAAMVELWADRYPGAATSVRLGPALILPLGRQRLVLQAELPLAGGSEPRLKLALWSVF